MAARSSGLSPLPRTFNFAVRRLPPATRRSSAVMGTRSTDVMRDTEELIAELIAGKLVEEAKRQLVFTLGSVQEIGFRLGFADPAYFSRFFFKYTGETPRVWQ